MIVEKIALKDFRNYESASIDLAPGLVLLRGRNAQGKTNLLEGIYCLSGLGSPRPGEARLVREGAEKGYAHGRINRSGRAVEIDVEFRSGRGMRALLNKTPVRGARTLSEVMVAVFFGPDDLNLVKGSPDSRRRFVDELAVKLFPKNEGQRREWERVLRQRNSLLKTAPRVGDSSTLKTLEVWDDSFCRAGAGLTATRLRTLAKLFPHSSDAYDEISGGHELNVQYDSAWVDRHVSDKALAEPATIDEEALFLSLAEALRAVRARELERGISLVGPQRDDVGLRLRNDDRGEWRDARLFASQGEQRSGALALKLGEFRLLSEILDEKPVLILDDVLSELDSGRRRWLGQAIASADQTIMSSAEAGPDESAAASLILDVEAASVTASA
ncbi:MAG: DNA replication/repair protein RecF [Actinomycetota bacterium]|nr:DNA replication/repair protein RecF [Actinomycetota bacterium]